MAHENRVDVPTVGAPARRRAVALDETSANAGHADDVRATLSSSPQRGAAKRRVSTARIAAATVLIFFLGVGRAAAATGRSGDSRYMCVCIRVCVRVCVCACLCVSVCVCA